MELKTSRLKIREIVQTDLSDLMKTYNNLEVVKHLYLSPYPLTREETQEFIFQCGSEAKQKPRTNYNLGIDFDGQVIGLVQILNLDKFQETAMLGFSLSEKYWGRGITTEAVREVIRFAFQEQNLRRIDSEANVENEGSNRVLRELGFCLEGTRIGYRKMKSTGKIHDVHIYGLINLHKTSRN